MFPALGILTLSWWTTLKALLQRSFNIGAEREKGLVHLTEAPYHPVKTGAAEILVQENTAPTVHSSNQLLNGRQIRWKFDALFSPPVHIAQQVQGNVISNSNKITRGGQNYTVGDTCYALYLGPRWTEQSRLVPVIISKVYGTRSVNGNNLRGSCNPDITQRRMQIQEKIKTVELKLNHQCHQCQHLNEQYLFKSERYVSSDKLTEMSMKQTFHADLDEPNQTRTYNLAWS